MRRKRLQPPPRHPWRRHLHPLPVAALAPVAAAPAAVPIAAPVVAAVAPGGRVKASPLARKIAQAQGVSLQGLPGSGPGGRIVKRDVEDALARGVGRSSGRRIWPKRFRREDPTGHGTSTVHRRGDQSDAKDHRRAFGREQNPSSSLLPTGQRGYGSSHGPPETGQYPARRRKSFGQRPDRQSGCFGGTRRSPRRTPPGTRMGETPVFASSRKCTSGLQLPWKTAW